MSLNDFLDKKIVVKQIKSGIKLGRKESACLIGLGLRGINSKSNLTCTQSISGMIRKVNHIVEVELA